MERPPALPEGALIRRAREAAGITVPAAARAARISKARWTQVETGYETRQGQPRPVRAKASTIAHMASAVGVTPERLETEGGRPDAAEVLREIARAPEREPLSLVADGHGPAGTAAGDDMAAMVAVVTRAIMSRTNVPLEQRERELSKALAAIGTAGDARQALRPGR